ncbi:arsenosugar biosynthesis radical SAM protein ArsS [Aromatoleum toluclasticum]|uniref:arsenosugar biosynthesis radical SAM (seleno)protein ArsS n=1 Tax=Aromatoleum toluclasticum TaxID=92003 RepID=UPI001D17E82C|nr:arsenosugar biosynthesis radical SAM (seleno)protein ArsS [Aromatoleum toluclasticum]MCC4116282.1 arsenosugar biosynthesis radical SAM protein ArsS [Aromatoleum toluclasticum]
MHPTFPLLAATDFPRIRRGTIETLQVNLGYRCNQSCVHCHVNAGPTRSEEMSVDNANAVLDFIAASPSVTTLDLTGGAPEMNANFLRLVKAARARGLRVIDRCNLTILEEPGYEDLAQFLANQGVEIVASLPCYLEDNVDRQRGKGVFGGSIRTLKKLNALGYGASGSNLQLNLVYNPQGPVLPPPQEALEGAYREHLGETFGIVFNQLFTLANMPIKRFGSLLVSKGQFHDYMRTLRDAHRSENLTAVMCRSLVSVDWQGYLYDCDFNQQLGMPIAGDAHSRLHLRDATAATLAGGVIRVADHCYGCTAGQGSSCGGALGDDHPATSRCAA